MLNYKRVIITSVYKTLQDLFSGAMWLTFEFTTLLANKTCLATMYDKSSIDQGVNNNPQYGSMKTPATGTIYTTALQIVYQ